MISLNLPSRGNQSASTRFKRIRAVSAMLAGTILLAPSASAVPPRSHPAASPAASQLQKVAVFGSDDRVPLPRDRENLRGKVGVLFSPRARTLCSAFCVADDVIATAAHCLFRTAGDTYPALEDFRFGSSKDNTKTHVRLAGFASRSTLQSIVAGSMSLSVRPPIDATRDWALAKLASPACKAKGFPLQPLSETALQKEGAAGRLFMIGFHRDFPDWRLAMSPGCEIKTVRDVPDGDSVGRDFVEPERLLLHTCDTGGASSGSPILMQTPTGPVVVGINVGTYVQSKVMMNNGEVVHRFKASEIANTAASVAPVAAVLPLLQNADLPRTVEQIRDAQLALKLRGLFAGPADGQYSPKLKQAMEEYQRRDGLPVTGLLTNDVLLRLTSAHRSSIPAASRLGESR